MEDLEDDLRAPRINLADVPEDKDIKKSDSFCSRIVQQNTRHCDRYIRCLTFLKILKHSFPEQTVFEPPFPRPTCSPFPCFQCHRRFSGPPVFIPMPMLDGTREEWGNFCSGPCANTYLHTNMPNVDLAARAADLFYYLQENYGFSGTQIGLAPHFSLHVDYGGHLTDAAFTKDLEEPTLTSLIRTRPFYPTDAVVEVVAPAGDILEGVVGVPIPSTVSERQQHRWELRGLRAPSLEANEIRLASLPKLEKRQGAYELFLARTGNTEASADVVDDIAAPKKSTQKKRVPALVDDRAATVSGNNTLSGMLTSATKPRATAAKKGQ